MQAPDPDEIVHRPSREFVESTNVYEFMREYDIADYDELIARTCGGVEGEGAGVDWFWDEVVDYLGIEFYEDYDRVRDDAGGPQFAAWYPGGRINLAHNVVDRHADGAAGDRAACRWEGESGEVREVTFRELRREADRVANYLDGRGVETGDTVALYMPMVPEVVSVLYGCFKVGAIAVPIFSGFGVEAVATRLADAEPAVAFTADGFSRRGKEVRLKETFDAAVETLREEGRGDSVARVVVYDRLGSAPDGVPWRDGRDRWWRESVLEADPDYETKSLPSDQESMLLYSSGTTGRPKGIVHTHAGVLLQCAKEIYFGFDHRDSDRFFWLSDIGWMMGPWTLIGNHAFAGTVFLYEGAPDYPHAGRLWELIERHDLTVFGISPTAIRALRRRGASEAESGVPGGDKSAGSALPDGYDLSSLRLLGSTGEPWDPESWLWFHEVVGGGEVPIINISGGTEICGCFLMPMPTRPLKPTTLGGPGLGMDVDIVDADGNSVADAHERGHLVARDSCPSMTKSLWEGDERYLEEYWSTWEGLWDHGDWARKDEDGFWFLLGRADDALNVAGRKVGPAEIEGVLIEHEAVTQAAAVGVPDETTGTAVVAYVTLEPGVDPSDDLRAELRELVGREHGKPFRPREILFVGDLPRTQSGKIVRRAVAAVHAGEDPGDLGSVENPGALDEIRAAR